MLLFPEHLATNERLGPMGKTHGPTGTLAQFLKDFGPVLLQKAKGDRGVQCTLGNTGRTRRCVVQALDP